MKKSIWKFELEVTDKQEIKMPAGAEILTVQTQYGIPCLWAMVDTEKDLSERLIEIFGTGHRVPQDMGVMREYIGTFQLRGGELVFHAFERTN